MKLPSANTLKNLFSQHPHISAASLLCLFTFIFFWESWIAGKIPFLRDMFLGNIPFYKFAGMAFWDGQVPLWNPYTRFGQPFIPTSLVGLFYPFTLLFYFLNTSLSIKLILNFHLFLSAFGLYVLSRQWKIGWASSVFISICFSFSTYMVAQMEFPIFFACAWAPWVLLSVQLLLDGFAKPGTGWFRDLRLLLPEIVMLSATMSMQFLSGYPQIFLYTLILCAILIFSHLISSKTRTAVTPAIFASVIAGVLALGVIMIQFLPTYESIGFSIRKDNFNPDMGNASFPLSHFISLLSPFFFGSPGYPDKWFGGGTLFEFWIATCYIGVLPLIMITCLTFIRKLPSWKYDETNGIATKRFIILTFSVVVLVSGFILALGNNTPVYGFLVNHTPFFNKFRWPSKFLFFVALGLSILSGLGFQALTDFSISRKHAVKINPPWQFWLWTGIGFFLLALPVIFRHSPSSLEYFFPLSDKYDKISLARHFPRLLNDLTLSSLYVFICSVVFLSFFWFSGIRQTVFTGIVILTAFINLFLVTKNIQPLMTPDDIYDYNPPNASDGLFTDPNWRIHTVYIYSGTLLYGTRDVEVVRWSKQASAGDTALPYLHYRTGGQCAVLNLWRSEHLYKILIDSKLPEAKRERLMDLLSVRICIGGDYNRDIFSGNAPRTVTLIERPTWQPRAIVADLNKVYTCRSLDDALKLILNSSSYDISRNATVELTQQQWNDYCSSTPSAPQQDTDLSQPAGKLIVIRQGWNRIDLKVEVTRPGLLTLNESWDKGWKVFVDGKEKPVLLANAAFMGTMVEPGAQVVSFEYNPASFKTGSLISLSSIGFCCILLAMGLGSRRKTN
ncbi:MAG: YfhO family protein [Victivallales bacterium]